MLPLPCLNGQTYRPEFWYVGQVKLHLDQVKRSKVKVTRSKRFKVCLSNVKTAGMQWGRNMPDEAVQRGRCKTSITFNTNAGPTTQGVFKAYAFSYDIVLPVHKVHQTDSF